MNSRSLLRVLRDDEDVPSDLYSKQVHELKNHLMQRKDFSDLSPIPKNQLDACVREYPIDFLGLVAGH